MEYVYGIHAVEALLQSRPGDIGSIYCQTGREDQRMQHILDLAEKHGVRIESLPRKKLDDMIDGRHQGVVAKATMPQINWGEEELFEQLSALDHPPMLLVLDGVTDPHNLGACLRSAEAAGVDAVIVPKDKSADLNATVRKVACGAAETMPFVRVTNLARTLEKLKQQGIWLYGTAGEAAQSVFEVDLKGPVALVMGAEGKGMRRLTREHCDYLVNLPMAGAVSSLNVSVATGICLFEAVRQRAKG
jgi:23S rRNA (guanosine2251-2'-O)-methyltransferase